MNKDTNTYVLTIAKTGGRERPRPRLSFSGDWLYDIGFAPGVLVQALPVPGGVDFRLCDEGISSYSGLFKETRDMGGTLIRAYLAKDCGRIAPAFVTSGKRILSGGLAVGDTLLAEYGKGLIRARKITPEMFGFENLMAITTTHIHKNHPCGPVPQVLLCGQWLDSIGFGVGAAAIAEASPGVLALTLVGPGTDHATLIKYARERKLKIVQARKDTHKRNGPRPSIGVTGSLIKKAGFTPGDMLAASYGYGSIKLQKLDFEKLGF